MLLSMELINIIRDKIPFRRLENRDDIGYQPSSFPKQPHLELFNDVHNEHGVKCGSSSVAKLWRVDEKGREALFSSYLRYANCIVVVTQNEIDQMAATYQYQHMLANISYELYIYSAKSFLDWHLEQFKRPKSYTLETTHLVHVTVIQDESLIIAFGFNSDSQLTLYCYSITCQTPFSFQTFSETSDTRDDPVVITNNVESGELPYLIQCCKPYVIKENQFSKLSTKVATETQQNGRLAIVFTDYSDRPRLNLLFIWQISPKITLLKYFDLRSVYSCLRGVVSGMCFWNELNDMIIATNTAQLFHLSLNGSEFSKQYVNLKEKHIFLEKEEETIGIIKLNPKYQRDGKIAIYGIGECGTLFLIPHLDDWRTQPIKMISLTDKLPPFNDFKLYNYQVSNYSKELFLLGKNRYLYIYDLAYHRFNNALCLPNDKHQIDEYWNMKMSVNWFGTEVYFVCYDHLYCVECPVVNTNLKQMARTVVLKNFSEDFLVGLNISKPILGFILNKSAK